MDTVYVFCPHCGSVTGEEPYDRRSDEDKYYEQVNIYGVPYSECSSCKKDFLSPLNEQALRRMYSDGYGRSTGTYSLYWSSQVDKDFDDPAYRKKFYLEYYQKRRRDVSLLTPKPPVQQQRPPVQQQRPPVQQQRPPVQQQGFSNVLHPSGQIDTLATIRQQNQQKAPVQQQRPPVQQQVPITPINQTLSKTEQQDIVIRNYVAQVLQLSQTQPRAPYSWMDPDDGDEEYTVTSTPHICSECGRPTEVEIFGFNLDFKQPKWFFNLPVYSCYYCDIDQIEDNMYFFCSVFAEKYPHFPWAYSPVDVKLVLGI